MLKIRLQGTIRDKAGEKVATLTTDKNGEASIPLTHTTLSHM